MKAVIATIPSDSHSWNLVFMDLLLKEQGFETVNLGVCTAVDAVCQAVREHDPYIVVISSINGHAYIEAPAIAEAIRVGAPWSRAHLIIGGKLGIDGDRNERHVAPLVDAGFDRVFSDQAGNDGITEFLQHVQWLVRESNHARRYG